MGKHTSNLGMPVGAFLMSYLILHSMLFRLMMIGLPFRSSSLDTNMSMGRVLDVVWVVFWILCWDINTLESRGKAREGRGNIML